MGIYNASGKPPRRQTPDESGDCADIIQGYNGRRMREAFVVYRRRPYPPPWNATGTSGSRDGLEQIAKGGQSRLLQGPLMLEKLIEACSVRSRHSTATQRLGELRVRAFVGSPGKAMQSHRRCLFQQSSCAREKIISWKEQI